REDLSKSDELADAAVIQRWHTDQVDSGAPKHQPALRVLLASFAEDRHLLLLSLPAWCADSASMRRLVELLGSAYCGHSKSRDIFQYSDFALWQQEMIGAEDSAAARDFWRQYFRRLELR